MSRLSLLLAALIVYSSIQVGPKSMHIHVHTFPQRLTACELPLVTSALLSSKTCQRSAVWKPKQTIPVFLMTRVLQCTIYQPAHTVAQALQTDNASG